jgi:hypothetical protein
MTASRLPYISVWILAGVLTGCTTLRPLPQTDPPGAPPVGLHTGDRVEVVTRDGLHTRLQVTEIGGTALTGTDAGGSSVQLLYAQIAQIKARRFSGTKTTWLIIAIVLTAGGLALEEALSHVALMTGG